MDGGRSLDRGVALDLIRETVCAAVNDGLATFTARYLAAAIAFATEVPELFFVAPPGFKTGHEISAQMSINLLS